MAGFVAASAVGSTEVAGEYAFEIDPTWTIGGKPNGGYLLAAMARACVAELASTDRPHPHPESATATYLAAPDPGPATVATTVLRAGRSASQVRAVLRQGGRDCVDAVVILATLGREAVPRYAGAPPAEVAARDRCVPLGEVAIGGGFEIPMHQVVDLRLDPARAGFLAGRPSGEPEVRGWLTLADVDAPDPFTLLFAVDCMPPATLELGSSGWVPTLSLTAYVRALPAPGPLCVRQRAVVVDGGSVDETCEVWDAAGRLVAHGTQLARVRFSAG